MGLQAAEEGRTQTMSDKVIENNQVSVIGEIVSGFTFSHEVFGEGFYMVEVAVNRLSNYADYIPVMVSSFTSEQKSSGAKTQDLNFLRISSLTLSFPKRNGIMSFGRYCPDTLSSKII